MENELTNELTTDNFIKYQIYLNLYNKIYDDTIKNKGNLKDYFDNMLIGISLSENNLKKKKETMEIKNTQTDLEYYSIKLTNESMRKIFTKLFKKYKKDINIFDYIKKKKVICETFLKKYNREKYRMATNNENDDEFSENQIINDGKFNDMPSCSLNVKNSSVISNCSTDDEYSDSEYIPESDEESSEFSENYSSSEEENIVNTYQPVGHQQYFPVENKFIKVDNILDKKYIDIVSNNSDNFKENIMYFSRLGDDMKKDILSKLDKIEKSSVSSKPMLFRLLESKMNDTCKTEIYKKIKQIQSEKSFGDNSKLINWVDAVLSIPFGIYHMDKIDTNKKKDILKILSHSNKCLNDAIFGHMEAKNKILQIIAQKISNPKSEGLTIGIQGPPGNGKTTLIEKGLSKALNRPFKYISLGGATDSSYLVGHSYTYEGSIWGKISDILIKSKCMNPIIYFDELDKVSNTPKGDEIINTLIHLTDPSQNVHFQDRYFMGLDFDVSRCIFIFSYNEGHKINKILKDRITEIHTKGFNVNEKIIIAKDYLLPDICKNVGIPKNKIKFDKHILDFIIQTYTYEGGVRGLKKLLFEIVLEINLRNLNKQKILNRFVKYPIKITKRLLLEDFFIKKNQITKQKIHNNPSIGKINGMYACDNGLGGLSIIEAIEVPSNDKYSLKLTGQQGNVMKESMLVAKNLAWHLLPSSIQKKWFRKWKQEITGIHIHCPEASTPKDGPSAGTAITCAILSCLLKIPINNALAITGEIDLSGNVLEIGGLEEKLYWTKKAGVKIVIVPDQNRKDVQKIKRKYPKLINKNFKVILVNTIWDVLPHVFKNHNKCIKFNNPFSPRK
mgnify:CR=1 FL=1